LNSGRAPLNGRARFNRTGVAGGPIAPKLFYFDQPWISWTESINWINAHASRNDVVATVAPHLTFLKTDLKSVMPPMEKNTQREQEFLDSVPARYLVIASFEYLVIDQRYAQPMVEKYPEKWRLVYTAADNLTRVYERTDK
jgi:hypothetical protein